MTSQVKSWQQVMQDGWATTGRKFKIDVIDVSAGEDSREDILEKYKTAQDDEIVYLMGAPSSNDLEELISAYDLNPLIQMDVQHSSRKFTHTNAFVGPRQNKNTVLQDSANLKQIYESCFMNLTIRDQPSTVNEKKMRVV